MKHIVLILLLTVTTRVQSQGFEVLLSGDTLTIKETNIAVDPFGFGGNPLMRLQKGAATTTFHTYQNRHVDNKIDTVFKFTYGSDHFEVMKWGENENGLLAATVTTRNFETRYGLKVGVNKNEVISQLNKYGIKTIPGYLILENLEIYELVIFKFTDDTLSKITFEGYID